MPKMIQLRHVPDDLYRKLKSRAALAGLPLATVGVEAAKLWREIVDETRCLCDRCRRWLT